MEQLKAHWAHDADRTAQGENSCGLRAPRSTRHPPFFRKCRERLDALKSPGSARVTQMVYQADFVSLESESRYHKQFGRVAPLANASAAPCAVMTCGDAPAGAERSNGECGRKRGWE